MRRFWVRFIYGPDNKGVGCAMSGFTPRHVAAEIRRKYGTVRIKSISAIPGGMARSGR